MSARRATPESAQKLEKKGNLEGALKLWLELSAAAPDDSRLLLKVCELQEKGGQTGPANDSFRRLGALHLKEGFRAKAISVLRRGQKLVAHDVGGAMLLSEALQAEGKQREAVEVLQRTAAAVHARGDLKTEVALLTRAVSIDSTTTIELALADALRAAGEHQKAAEHLRVVADRLRAEHDSADRLRVLEQLLELEPKNTLVATEAAGLALEFRDGHRALVLVRRALDVRPEDPKLILLAGAALEIYGDAPRASRVFREAARVLTAAGDAGTRAKEAWMALLRVSPGDAEAHRAIAPAMAPDLAKLFAMRGALLNEIGGSEADDALRMLDDEPEPPAVPDSDVLEVSAEDLETGYTLVADPTSQAPSVFEPELSLEPPPAPAPVLMLVPDPPPEPAPLPEPLAPAVPAARVELPRPVRAANRAANFCPAPQRALVVGDDPEAGWVMQALSDLGIDALSLLPAELGRGAERALQHRSELVHCPAALAEVFAAGGSWLVAGPTQADRQTARAAAVAAGAPVMEQAAVATADELAQVLERWGGPAELVGPLGAPVEVSAAGQSGFALALARQRLGGEVWAQRPSAGAIWVVVAGDGARAVGLGEFAEVRLEGQGAVVSPSGEGESQRLELGAQVSAQLGLRGVGVVRLVPGEGGSWAVESMEPEWGPGGLAVEARLGASLVALAVELARGEPLPSGLATRGVAHAMSAPAASLGSLSNLRIETGLNGVVFLCAHATDAAQSARRLLRARQPKASPGG